MSLSFVRDLSRRFREDGSVVPKAHGGGRPPVPTPEAQAAIQAAVAAHNDHSIGEHRQSLVGAGYSFLTRRWATGCCAWA